MTTKGDTVLVVCRVGCENAAIISELQALDLWPRPADVVRFPAASRSERKVRAPAPKLVSEKRFEIKNLSAQAEAVKVRREYEDGSKDFILERPGGRTGLGGRKPSSLPLYGMEQLADLADGATVVLGEGEQVGDALRDLGLVGLGTVTGADTIHDDDVLQPLVRLDLVLWADLDDKGRSHMRRIAERLVALGGRARLLEWPGATEKGDDAADMLERGGTPEEAAALVAEAKPFDPIAEQLAALPIISAVELAAKTFADPKVIVPRLLLEGAVMLVAPGKSGKSRLMMAVAVGVAHGGCVLGSIDVDGGDVLYLALEDGQRRGQSRMLQASGNNPPARLDMAFSWKTMDAGGLIDIEGWLKSKPGARLVVVDTLKRFRERTNGRRNAYDEDYEALAPLNDLALRYGVCIVVVHHTNKIRMSEDPTDRASGSTGMLAACDGMIVMERSRGKADAILHVFHRDLEDAKLAIKSDQDLGWSFLGDAADFARTGFQDDVVNTILEAGRPLKPTDVATALDRDRKDVGTAMWKMTKPNGNGLIILISQAGHYWPTTHPWPEPPDDENTSNRSNRSNRSKTSNRSNRDDQEGLFTPEGDPVAVETFSGESRATGQPGADQEREARPVAPVAPVPQIPPVWRCACGSYEWHATHYDTKVCDGCGQPAEGVSR